MGSGYVSMEERTKVEDAQEWAVILDKFEAGCEVVIEAVGVTEVFDAFEILEVESIVDAQFARVEEFCIPTIHRPLQTERPRQQILKHWLLQTREEFHLQESICGRSNRFLQLRRGFNQSCARRKFLHIIATNLTRGQYILPHRIVYQLTASKATHHLVFPFFMT